MPSHSVSATVINNTSINKLPWFLSLANHIDVRILLIGSLLPDIIDKPIGQYFFSDTFSSGRLFCHTLLFFILITIAGAVLYKIRRHVWLLTLSFCTLIHLILDQMWLTPRTLFWPLYGLEFESEPLTGWIMTIFNALLTNYQVYIPEIVGAVVLFWFSSVLVRKKTFFSFIKHGRIS